MDSCINLLKQSYDIDVKLIINAKINNDNFIIKMLILKRSILIYIKELAL